MTTCVKNIGNEFAKLLNPCFYEPDTKTEETTKIKEEMKPEEETEEEEETKLDVCSAQDIFFDFKPPVPVPVAVGEQVAVGEPTTALIEIEFTDAPPKTQEELNDEAANSDLEYEPGIGESLERTVTVNGKSSLGGVTFGTAITFNENGVPKTIDVTVDGDVEKTATKAAKTFYGWMSQKVDAHFKAICEKEKACEGAKGLWNMANVVKTVKESCDKEKKKEKVADQIKGALSVDGGASREHTEEEVLEEDEINHLSPLQQIQKELYQDGAKKEKEMMGLLVDQLEQ